LHETSAKNTRKRKINTQSRRYVLDTASTNLLQSVLNILTTFGRG